MNTNNYIIKDAVNKRNQLLEMWEIRITDSSLVSPYKYSCNIKNMCPNKIKKMKKIKTFQI